MANSPSALIHFPATSESPHIVALSVLLHEYGWLCLQNPVFSVLCLQLCFSFSFTVLVVCIIEWFTLVNATVTNVFLSSSVWHLALSLIQSASPAHSVAPLAHTHRRLCQLHLCCHLVWLYVSFFHSKCLRGLPPFRASSLNNLPRGMNYRTRPFITDPPHSSPRTFGDHLRQKEYPYFLAIQQVLV